MEAACHAARMGDEFDEGKWFDQSTVAPRPGAVEIDFARLAWFQRRLNWGHRFLGVGLVPRDRWAVHLQKGLAEPALVMSARPVIVAVYSREFDGVAMLRFRDLPAERKVSEGERLLSVNTFERAQKRGALARDLVRGAETDSVWCNVHPAIADFLSDDIEVIAARKRQIGESEWRRTEELGAAYRKRFPRRLRDGNPYLSHLEAK
jgi:hypothetical protein